MLDTPVLAARRQTAKVEYTVVGVAMAVVLIWGAGLVVLVTQPADRALAIAFTIAVAVLASALLGSALRRPALRRPALRPPVWTATELRTRAVAR